MFTHIPTGQRFNNRKEAKMVLGSANYNRELRKGNFTLHCLDEEYRKNTSL